MTVDYLPTTKAKTKQKNIANHFYCVFLARYYQHQVTIT